MGPSGSGKSTLLYAVSGMDSITAGEAKFCGKSIAKMGEKELADLRLDEMGFIFQQMYMLKNLTVLGVDLPEPDGPITATISPSETVKFTFFKMLFWRLFTIYVLQRSFTSKIFITVSLACS